MKEYGRKPYIAKNYRDMMKKTPNQAMWNQIVQKHSEFEKPYLLKAGQYPEMQYYYPNLPGLGFGDLNFDHPWMDETVPDADEIPVSMFGVSGCGFKFPGLFSQIAKCETKCVYLDEWYKSITGRPDDPIIAWDVTDNAEIVSSNKLGACVKVKESATTGELVKITATTKSGAKCNSVSWVAGDDCDQCVPDAAMAWDDDNSDDTIARNSDASLAIIGNNSPFTWSVSGTGFTLEHTITDDLTNTLHADGTACGIATITVVGCDDVSVDAQIKCTTGNWSTDFNVDQPYPDGYYGGNCYDAGMCAGISYCEGKSIGGTTVYVYLDSMHRSARNNYQHDCCQNGGVCDWTQLTYTFSDGYETNVQELANPSNGGQYGCYKGTFRGEIWGC